MTSGGHVQSRVSLTAASNDAITMSLEQVAKRFDIRPSTLARMMLVIQDQAHPTEELAIRLQELALQHNKLIGRLRATSNDDAEVQRLRAGAAEALEQGDFDGADASLVEAESVDARAATAERADRLLSRAETSARRGELARVRLNYSAAAMHFSQAAATVPKQALAKRWDYLMEEAAVLYELGSQLGNTTALIQAIEVYSTLL